ncbi:MAG: Hpt domain-containing protein [Lentisphaeria bacterium]|nr:Hpt domain-containing protein [Lentisphaeria bacterium]
MIINYTQALEVFDNNEDFFVEVITDFLQNEFDVYLDVFYSACEAKDAKLINENAHKIKSAVLNIGAENLSESAHKVETIAKNDELNTLDSLLEQFKREVIDLKAELNKYLENR